ncbi:MAG: hypothetical protein OHK0048_13920 [Rhodoferax sp.]
MKPATQPRRGWRVECQPVLRALLLSAGLLGTAWAQDSTEADWLRNPAMGNYKAYAEFKMAHYAQARHIWQVLAGVGNADALFNLAVLAEDGLGEPADLDKAMALYTAAAQAGGFKAQYRLGLIYSTASGPRANPEQARYYLGLAAAHGDADAAERLARLQSPSAAPPSLFEQAQTLDAQQRPTQAAELYQQAANQNDLRALTRLAWLYEAGRGVPRDLARAASLFERAAHAGDAQAQYALAVMYRTGVGQPRDRQRSLQWLQRAADQGDPAARAALQAERDAAADSIDTPAESAPADTAPPSPAVSKP